MLSAHNHNFIRLWSWEHATWAPWTADRVSFEPTAYLRTGPGIALDGGLKFDLTRFNPVYFDRLYARVSEAAARNLFVSVMLFQGFSAKKPGLCGDPWPGHPFHPANNINGFDGDRNRDSAPDLDDPGVRRLHAAYLRRVVETVNNLDNVLYEVINEGGNHDWDRFVVDTVHSLEDVRGRRHPVGLTGHGAEDLEHALSSNAEWIAPGSSDNLLFTTDPPPWTGRKVCMLDTDHLWGHGGTASWAWKSFLRGYHTALMDPWEPIVGRPCPFVNWGPRAGAPTRNVNRRSDPIWEPVRKAIGNTRRYASRIDLASMRVAPEYASTLYCLANVGRDYLAYMPEGDSVRMDLSDTDGTFAVEWMEAIEGTVTAGGVVQGRDWRHLYVPFVGPAVLYLNRIGATQG